jgi:hypothetical protein
VIWHFGQPGGPSTLQEEAWDRSHFVVSGVGAAFGLFVSALKTDTGKNTIVTNKIRTAIIFPSCFIFKGPTHNYTLSAKKNSLTKNHISSLKVKTRLRGH